jgi:uncharacterized repeat protein (TIGR02543 family)
MKVFVPFTAVLIIAVLVGAFTACKSPEPLPTQYTIAFNSGGGSQVSPITAVEGMNINPPSEPTKSGNVFQGWYTAASGGDLITWPHLLTGNMTMYAQWMSRTAQTAIDNFKDKAKTALAKNPTDIGLNTDATELESIAAEIRDALQIYDSAPAAAKDALTGEKAKLDALDKRITNVQSALNFSSSHRGILDKNIGTVSLADETALNEALAAYNKLDQAVKTLLTQEYQDLNALKDRIAGLKTGDLYTITFNSEGGTSVASITGNAGSSVNAPASPTKGGYTFAGWYSAASGGTPYTWPYILTGNVTMYAHWQPGDMPKPAQYTITFNSQGGTSVAPITGNAGAPVNAPASPTKGGYAFVGWYSAANGGTPYTWPHPLTGNVTMYAHWLPVAMPEPDQYTITFDSQGGTPVASITGNAGAPVNAPVSPTKGGYAFAGWYSAANGGTPFSWPYTPTGNVIMYAHWQPSDMPEPGPDQQWTEVTTLSQLDGTWEGSFTKDVPMGYYTMTFNVQERITIDAAAETRQKHENVEIVFSGSMIETMWPFIVGSMAPGENTTIVEIDNEEHTIRGVYHDDAPIPMDPADYAGVQISQDGNSIKIPVTMAGEESSMEVLTRKSDS